MDFASIMGAQIAKGSEGPAGASKLVKRSEVEAQRRAAYEAEQAAAEAGRQTRAAQKRQAEETELALSREREQKRRRLAEHAARLHEQATDEAERARRARVGLPPPPPRRTADSTGPDGGDGDDDDSGDNTAATVQALADESEATVDAKLRQLGEPTRLFGESGTERRQRLAGIITQRHWQAKKKKKRAEAEAAGGEEKGGRVWRGAIDTRLEPVAETQMKVPARVAASVDAAGRRAIARQLTSYFNMVLREWERAMGGREAAVQTSFQGRAAQRAMEQARANLRPLFGKLEADALEASMLDAVVEIVHCAQERRYVAANDGYLRLSIGKA